MKQIVAFFLSILLCSCSPHKQLARIITKHPELHRDSILAYHDTITYQGVRDSVFIHKDSLLAVASTTSTSEQKSSNATSVVAGNATAVLSTTSNGFWLKAEQKPDTVFIDIEKEIPVYITEVKEKLLPLTKWQTFTMNMGKLLIGVISFAIVLQIVKIITSKFND